MTKQPLISIVTPSYNQAPFLEKTIRSVLEQDYPNLEYLIADGGSTDGSVEIIQKFSHKLAWWVSEKDSGQAEAINKGLHRARGEFVAWVNSDDFYEPGAVAEAVTALQQNPDVAFVFGKVKVVDPSQRVLNNLSYGDWSLRDLMAFRIIGQPAVFIRKSVLDQVGLLDTSFHFLLDHQLWLRLAQASGMKYVPLRWAVAHYHEDCKNLAQAAEFGKEALRIVEWMRGDSKFRDQFNLYSKKIEAGAERLNAFYLVEAREYRSAFKAYWRSFMLNPAMTSSERNRMVFAFFAPLGFERIKDRIIENRRKRINL
jgi:glycosyltransferase involved in cell wall biosynthesis